MSSDSTCRRLRGRRRVSPQTPLRGPRRPTVPIPAHADTTHPYSDPAAWPDLSPKAENGSPASPASTAPHHLETADRLAPPDPPAGGPLPSSLEPSETTAHRSANGPPLQRHIHARWSNARHATLSAFESSTDPTHARRAHRIRECCRTTLILRRSTGAYAASPIRCRDRLCPLCAAARAREAATRARSLVNGLDTCRFLTLTAPHLDLPLADHLAALRAAFRRLRRTDAWRDHVRGGLYAIEITRSPTTGAWHPHIHILADGTYFPHGELRDAWRAALRHHASPWNLDHDDAVIVDVRAAHDRRSVARYVAEYVTKPRAMADWPAHAILEYADALHGARVLATFGSLHGVTVDAAEPNPDPGAPESITTVGQLVRAARDRDHHAARAFGLLTRLLPMLAHAAPDLAAPPLDTDGDDAARLAADIDAALAAWQNRDPGPGWAGPL